MGYLSCFGETVPAPALGRLFVRLGALYPDGSEVKGPVRELVPSTAKLEPWLWIGMPLVFGVSCLGVRANLRRVGSSVSERVVPIVFGRR